jgi:hypothetical protein
MPASISPALTSDRPFSASANIFDVNRSHLTRQRDRPLRLHASRLGIVIGQQRQMSTQHRHAGSGHRRRLPVHEQRGALDPARCLRLPAERVAVVGELNGKRRRGRTVALRPGETIPQLVRLDRDLAIEFVARDAEPLVGVGRLYLPECLRKPRPSLAPRPTRQQRKPPRPSLDRDPPPSTAQDIHRPEIAIPDAGTAGHNARSHAAPPRERLSHRAVVPCLAATNTAPGGQQPTEQQVIGCWFAA